MITHASAQTHSAHPRRDAELGHEMGDALDHGIDSSTKSISSKARSFGGSCSNPATACAPG
jgi:hypothetical protein